MAENWEWVTTDADAAVEISAFLPDAIFDFHAHLYNQSFIGPTPGDLLRQGPQDVDLTLWQQCVGRQVGKSRLAGGLFIPLPEKGCDIDASNSYLIGQLSSLSMSRGLIVVSPDSDPHTTASLLDNPQIIGFKPYHVFSREQPTFQSSLGGFIPEWVWHLAHQRGLIITLHMVRDLALADENNQREIRSLCTRYPNARLILAHAGRGFHGPNTAKGVKALTDLQNVWYDSSAICEVQPLLAILQACGPRRLLFGSDFPVCERRGRCVTVGDAFSWINPERVDANPDSPLCQTLPVGLESLRALKHAAELFGLNEEDLRDIFHDNAIRLLGLKDQGEDLTQERYRRARQIIPGGTGLLSKRPEMFAPDQWPAYMREARGCEVWDLDGRHYYDFSTSGIGACLLGYRDPEVTKAVQRRINLGSFSTLNPPEEVELAERLLAIHPWAQQARFQRTGGEACAVAIRIARATTDRSIVAVCGYHGWSDWYLAANLGEDDSLRGHVLPGLQPLGVPRELRGTTLAFTYNNRQEFQEILDHHGDKLAAVIMEPCRYNDPEPGFLQFVREGTQRVGALLIYDEITIGFRLVHGGSHLKFGVSPDIAIFAKALGNGHPISAVLGTSSGMEGAHSSFISSTYWTENVGPTAAIATLGQMERLDVPAHVARIGEMVQAVWKKGIATHHLPANVSKGYPCLSTFKFDHPQGEALRTLFTQQMLAREFLAGTTFYPMLAHTEAVVQKYAAAADEVFSELSAAVETDSIQSRLKGPVAHSGFQRLL